MLAWELPDGTKRKGRPSSDDDGVAKLVRWSTRYRVTSPDQPPPPRSDVEKARQDSQREQRALFQDKNPYQQEDDAARRLLPSGEAFGHVKADDPGAALVTRWHVTWRPDDGWAGKDVPLALGMISLDPGQRVRCPKCGRVQMLGEEHEAEEYRAAMEERKREMKERMMFMQGLALHDALQARLDSLDASEGSERRKLQEAVNDIRERLLAFPPSPLQDHLAVPYTERMTRPPSPRGA